MNEQHIVIFDAHNYFHRCRAGFGKGDFSVVYTFFRSLRAQVEKLKPTQVIFVLEGKPLRQQALNEDYKANREVDPKSDPEKHAALELFWAEKDIIVNILASLFPVYCIRHKQFEADDTIYNLVANAEPSVSITVVSTDTDFIQLLNEFENVTLYNPVKKSIVEKPDYDYAKWKALRGDACDNIPGIPGIGDKTATKLINDPKLFEEKITNNPEKLAIWENNLKQIKLAKFSEKELSEVLHNVPTRNWDEVRKVFEKMQFNSILKDKAWVKFVGTFDELWGNFDHDPKTEKF